MSQNIKKLNPKIGAFKPILKVLNLNKEIILIINPGLNSKEFLEEEVIIKKYDIIEYTISSSQDLENYINTITYDIILLDSSGLKTLSKKDLSYLNFLKINKIKVFDLVDFFEKCTGRIPLVHLSKSWILNNNLFHVDTKGKFLRLKRLFDIVTSLILLPVGIFLVVPAILLIKLSSKGPAIFKQKRVGKEGKPFYIFKLRTMSNNHGINTFTQKKDNRVTSVGKILRVTKIDELPQLINILNGDMSLVGPRPEQFDIVEQFAEENPYYTLRHLIRPGVTGWAQVNHPTATPLENLQKLEYDLYYIKNISPILDIKVLWRTVKVIITLDSL